MTTTDPKRHEFLSPTEQTLQRVITADRWGYTRASARCKDLTQLGYLFDDAMRGGSVYSPYAQFRADMQVEWAMRTLSALTELRVEYDRCKVASFGWEDGWDKAKVEIERLFNEKYEADRAEIQEEYDACVADDALDEFNRYHSVPVVDGVVGDPWGFPEALWFLRNMTKFTVFTVWQTVNEAVQECLNESLGNFAEGGTDGDPRKVASETFEKVIRNLYEHIVKAMKEEAEQAAEEARKAAVQATPISSVADLLDEARA